MSRRSAKPEVSVLRLLLLWVVMAGALAALGFRL